MINAPRLTARGNVEGFVGFEERGPRNGEFEFINFDSNDSDEFLESDDISRAVRRETHCPSIIIN